MSSNDIAISVKNLTKTYRIFGHPGDRIKQALTFGQKQYHKEFTALKDVSFEIKKGETVGIIGRNGSGKSTLLQLICGILKPTSGSVTVNGRISALLELGAGFNPEFTGRENVYFQGAVMGFTQTQMDDRLSDIANFANIGPFLDQPVRTYSSGMFVRLAFSVAVHVEPGILIIDEALSVGDAEFQERSISRMRLLQEHGSTILFVSHSIPAVRNFCQRAIWLDGGLIQQVGVASNICQAYQGEIAVRRAGHVGEESIDTASARLHPSGREKTIGIVRVFCDNAQIAVGEQLTLHFELAFSGSFDPITEFGLGVIITTDYGKLVTVLNTVRDDFILAAPTKEIGLQLSHTSFVPGLYWVSVNICDRDVMFAYDKREYCLSFEVAAATNRRGIPRWEGELACDHSWLL